MSEAVKFMKVVANNSYSTLLMIEIEVSKACLYRAVRFCRCSRLLQSKCLIGSFVPPCVLAVRFCFRVARHTIIAVWYIDL